MVYLSRGSISDSFGSWAMILLTALLLWPVRRRPSATRAIFRSTILILSLVRAFCGCDITRGIFLSTQVNTLNIIMPYTLNLPHQPAQSGHTRSKRSKKHTEAIKSSLRFDFSVHVPLSSQYTFYTYPRISQPDNGFSYNTGKILYFVEGKPQNPLSSLHWVIGPV